MKSKRVLSLVIIALILVLCFATGVSAEYSFVQNDPDNATKFSIEKEIADGFSTDDLYIGTVEAYLGENFDGKTPIFGGGVGCNAADILITNGVVGIVLAVATADPWGYPGGSILDAGSVSLPANSDDWSEAVFGKDTVLTCQLLFNNWDAWAPSNCGMVYFDLVKYNFQEYKIDETDGIWAVQVSRKFTVPDSGVERDFDIVSYYSIAPGVDYCYMFDTAKNNGAAAVTTAIKNQLSLSNQGGDGIDSKTVKDLTAAGTYNWVADAEGKPTRQFQTTLITPGENLSSDGSKHPFSGFSGAVGYREFNFEDTAYEPGESRLYESYLMIDDECSWQKVYDFYSDYHNLDTFNVSGTVTDSENNAVAYPVVIVNRDDYFYGWVMGDKDGKYSLDLPDEGAAHQYTLTVEVADTVASAPSGAFNNTAADTTIDLKTGAHKVPVVFNFTDADTGDPAWGRVMVGAAPTAAFTGKNYFMVDNSTQGALEADGYGPGTKDVVKGQVTAMVAPGDYSATCYGEGYNFSSFIAGTTSGSVKINGNTSSDPEQDIEVSFENPTPENWYGIDNHHHGQRMDAFSSPEVVAKAQVTAGLEVLTLDDHEFVLDNWPVYQWGQEMGIVGYMPSEEVTASWAHFDIMPLSVDCYEQFLDRNQKNLIVNTNQSLKGMMDEGHLFGASIGANHPTYSYGVLLADNNKTVPGGLVDDFDGLESQIRANYTNEAMTYWTAFINKESHRNVPVERPHYIWGSTDIHQSGTSANSGANRSYVFLENGETISAENFDSFGLEFARSQAIGHSFVSNGVYIIPATEDLMYGETYWTDKNGDFTAKFDISSLADITEVYVFSSMGDTVVSSGVFKSFKYNYSVDKFTNNLTTNIENYRVNLYDVKGKQWIAIGAVDSRGKSALTNPIWINGPNVKDEVISSVGFQTEPTLPENLEDGTAIAAPTSAGILVTEPWSVRMVEDWALKDAAFGDTAVGGKAYTYTLTYEAPQGYYFSQEISEQEGFSVSKDGTTLVYAQKVKALGGDYITEDDVTLAGGSVGTITPSQEQLLRWNAAGEGNTVFDFSDSEKLEGMENFVLTVDPAAFSESSLQIIMANGSSVTIPVGIWAQLDAAVEGTVDIAVTEKDGILAAAAKKDGEKIDLQSLKASVLYQIPYTAKTGEEVMGIIGKSDDEAIARSWYDADAKMLKAKAFGFIQCEPAYVDAKSFDDTEGKWMDESVRYLRARDVARGIGNNIFAESAKISRADATVLLVRVFDIGLGAKQPIAFKDADLIPDYAKEAVDIASSNELILGSNDNRFMPNDVISRQDLIVITYRALKQMNLIPGTLPDKEVAYVDLDKVSPYAEEAVNALTKLGLVNGYTDNTLKPLNSLSRGECCEIFCNALELDRK